MNRSLAILACTAALALPRVAAAKPHVALLPIVDDANGELADAVSAAVEDDVSLTTTREITHTMDKLQLGDQLSDRDLQKLVSELEVDALVRSVAEREGTTRVLHVRVYAFGKPSHGFTIRFGNPKSPKFRHAFRDALLDKLAQLSSDTRGKTKHVDARDVEVDDGHRAARDDHEEDPLHPHAGGDDDNGSGSSSGSGSGSAHDAAPPPSAASAHSFDHVAARADLGVSLLTRSFTFNSTAFPEAPKPYSQSPVPGVRFSGELYPFAISDPLRAIAGLGFAAEYDQTLQLSLTTPTQPDTPLSAIQRHWSVGLRYRLNFGRQPTSPSLTLALDYGGREFTIDRTPLMGGTIDLPDVSYLMIEPGAVFRLPLGRSVALTLAGHYLYVSSAGSIQDPTQYGPGGVYGVSGELGLEIAIGQHVAFRIAGEFTQIAFSFDGTGTMSNDRDNDPTTVDVYGATDRYIGGVATFAVLY